MRPLSQYFINGRGMTSVGTTNGGGQTLCVPRDGRLVGLVFHTFFSPDAEMTFRILKNNLSALPGGVHVAAVMPNAQPADSGFVPELRTAHAVPVKAGDSLHLESQQEGTADGNMEFAWIMERDSEEAISEFYLRSPAFQDIDTLVSSNRLATPWAGRLKGVALIPHTAIATAGGDHTFDYRKNNGVTNIDFRLPDGQADEDGLVMEAFDDGGGALDRYFAAGDSLRLDSNAEQVAAATHANLTFICERTGESNLGGHDLREYLMDLATIGLQVVGGPTAMVAVPDDGEVVGLAINSTTALDADIDLDLEVNGVNIPNVFFLANGAFGVNEGVYVRALSRQGVRVGDRVRLLSQGGGSANTAIATLVIRR